MSSIDLGSILIFASCVIDTPADRLSDGCFQTEYSQQHIIRWSVVSGGELALGHGIPLSGTKYLAKHTGMSAVRCRCQ